MKIQSTPITFIDQTDSRKLEVYIKSNLPTVQIFNQNSGAYTPDWREGEKLVLSMDVFLDSRTMTTTEYNSTTIKWYKNDVEMSDGSIEDISDDKRKITIKDNILKDNAIVTYTCEVTYQGIVASTRITFTRVDTGLNGSDGTDGKGVTILGSYSSVETLLEAHPTGNQGDAYIVDGDLYVWAVDNAEWENVGNIQGPKGEDAKSIILIGSAQVFKINQTRTVSTPTNITITPHTINISDEEKQGIRWEYRYNSNTQWLGLSEGEKFLDESTTLSDNIVTIDGSKLLNSNIISMSFKASVGYVEDVFTVYKALDGIDGAKGDQGEDAPIAFLSNENISFVADEDGLTYGGGQSVLTNVVAYLGTTKVMPQINLTLANSSLPDGMSIAIDEETMASIKSINPDFNEIILKISVRDGVNLGSDLSNNGTLPITVSSPASVSLQLSWSKINTGHTGVGIDKVSVTYSKSTSTTPIPTDWKTTIAEVNVVEGEYLWTKTVTQYTSDSKPATTTYTYAKQGVNGEKGEPGIPVTVTNIHYGKNLSSTTYPQNESDWSTAIVATKGGEYLWTRTTFSDGKKSYSVAQQGRGIDKITEYYLASTVSSGVTDSTSGWTEAVQTISASKRYLWNYEIITYTDGTTSSTPPIIIGVFGNTGSSGKGVKSITEYYLASSLETGVTTSTTGWSTTMQPLSEIDKYLWNYELITYTDNTTETIAPVIIGAYGDRGAPGESGDDAVTFQVYSNNGYALSTGVPTITLQTFAYLGDVEITAGATFQWHRHNGTDWVAVSNATNSYFNVSRDDVTFSNNYMCKMQFNGTEYVGVVTIEDKNDENKVFASKPSNYFAGDLWIVGTDYVPSKFTVGTMLRAEHTNSGYTETDWVLATKYDDEIEDLRSTVDSYKQYFSVNSTNGLQIGNSSINNDVLTIDRVEAKTVNTDTANMDSLNITGRYSGSTMLQAPIINLGKFSIVIENNGSLSIVANT